MNKSKCIQLRSEIQQTTGINIRSKKRDTDIALMRAAFGVYCAKNSELGVAAIGEIIGKDHSTVVHYKRNHLKMLAKLGARGRTYRSSWDFVNNIGPLKTFNETSSKQKKDTLISRTIVLQDELNEAKGVIERLRQECVTWKRKYHDALYGVDLPKSESEYYVEKLENEKKNRKTYIKDKFTSNTGINYY